MTNNTIFDQERVRELALSMPEAIESRHQGTPDFRVRNKIFATLPTDVERAVLKLTPADLDLFVHSDPETFRNVWAGRWMSVDLTRVDPDLFGRLLIDSWCLVAPKSLVKAFNENSRQS
jgi:hypothetical protein